MAGENVPSLTRLAARHLQQISKGHFSPEVRAQASLCLLDTLGAIQYGLTGELAGSLRAYASLNADRREATAFGCPEKVGAETAAFINGVLAHSAIRDDMHLGAVSHLGSMVVPAALALAQRDGWSGEQLMRAIVGGYEMGALLGTAIHERGRSNPHFRASGLIGAFAAAGAAICGQPTDEDTIVSALGLAVNSACGINEWAWSGGWELCIHNGTAARAGITSYSLAVAGVRASDTVLEGRDGFFTALGSGSGGADTFRKWIQESKIGRGILDVKFKPAACCNFTQTSTATALIIAKSGRLVAADVDLITVTTTTAAINYPGCDNIGPMKNALQGKLCIQYGVCAALVLVQLNENAWDPRCDMNITEMMPKCKLIASPEYDKKFKEGYQPAQVEVVLKNGKVHRQEAGDVPWLNESEVIARFLEEMSPFASENRVKRLLDQCQHLERVQQCRELLEV